MAKNFLRRASGRFLHLVARFAPGATSFRPFLHRLRGVQIGKGVFIGEEVYLENEYPERVEIQDGVQISLRAIILAHTRGAGTIILEKSCYIGPNVVIATSRDKVLRIGEGAVIGAGCVITKSVQAKLFISADLGRPVAEATLSLSNAGSMEEFIRGLRPIKPRPR
jgi:serine acetyltransferase